MGIALYMTLIKSHKKCDYFTALSLESNLRFLIFERCKVKASYKGHLINDISHITFTGY